MRFSVFWRVLVAQALSSFGTSMSTVALGFMVYTLTGSVLHMGAVMAVSTFPLIITSWIGGAALDRFAAKHVMVAADFARAVLIFLLPFLAEAAIVFVYAIAALVGVCTAFFNPGQLKLVAESVGPDHLVKANSYLGVTQTGSELVGYLVSGVVVSAVGYAVAFYADAGSYVLSGLLLLGLPRPQPRMEPPASVLALLRESPGVFVRLWRHPMLRTNLLFALFPMLVFMMGMPNSYGLALAVFERGAAGVAALEVAISCGFIVGGLVLSRMTLRRDKNLYVFGSFMVMALCLLGVYLSSFFWLAVAFLGLAGMASVGVLVPSVTMFQEIPSPGERGRLIAVRAGFGQVGSTGGLLLGGSVGEALGITQSFLLAGLLAVGLSMLIYVPYHVGVRRRLRDAWSQAVAAGATRVDARHMAEQAALAGRPELGSVVAGLGSREPVEAREAHSLGQARLADPNDKDTQ
ncbi:MAG: MFS transporter [Thermoleophilia bacterium]|nr:MFS transporter [Thermoleophilia bacterium]